MTKIIGKYHFFYKDKSPLTNWYQDSYTCEIPNKDGTNRMFTFLCSEGEWMFRKALFFNDWDKANEILEAKKPSEQMRLGREVKNFDEELWQNNKEEIIYKVLINKYTLGSNRVKNYLKNTAGQILVEASPTDIYNGIGMAEEDEGVDDPAKWKGLNTLGRLLTRVRIDLFGE